MSNDESPKLTYSALSHLNSTFGKRARFLDAIRAAVDAGEILGEKSQFDELKKARSGPASNIQNFCFFAIETEP